jgi:2'-5' RNA ligase
MPRARRKHRKLFFAILPDALIAEAIASGAKYLDKSLGIGGHLLRADRLHITLHVIGEYDETPEADVIAARKAGDAVVADAFELEFDRAMTFLAPKAYVLRVGDGLDKVDAFWLNLGMEIANVRPFKKQPFTPHMTLSYNGRPMLEHAIEPIRWTAQEFVLINSHVGETYHEVMGRWRLQA